MKLLLQIREADGEILSNPEDVWNFMQDEANLDRECLWILHLDGYHRLLDKELAAMGTIDTATIRPATV